VSPLRVSIRLINSLLENPKYGKYTGALNKFKQQLINELIEKCDLITQKLQQYVIGRKGNSTDTEAFFQKAVADFYRYICEFLPKNEEKKKETYK